jgi:PPK2 family polyphosphate:nucleotide phosphotransferase
MANLDVEAHRIRPGERVSLAERATKVDGGLDKKEAKKSMLPALHARMIELHERLFAQRRNALLVVLQSPDAAGKDSTIRRCFGVLNPQRAFTVPFLAPTRREKRRDFLWRAHRDVPPRGTIGIFNRSYYESVLVERVRELTPEERWRRRYAHINAFERLLHDTGTLVTKFYLHVSKAYQKERLERRLRRPDKHWKFDLDDLEDRARWDEYAAAYEDVFLRCSSADAPWYVVPSERRWYRDLVIAQAVVSRLERLDPQYPPPRFDPASITIE